ncbi:response regulator transcription factor [Cohnella silvisoli]|uniref:Response regulator n=1 Tax=Cohnella silvisoli TaxID=2873699 RepID=A0ABV1KQG3_9BACL|nr:helix-turn-helix domain-containing protein [Cohnella silvisoli]MCD9022007.1 response regulator [Cohnella silvisoli]
MKCMIVDDEPIFIMGIRKLLADYNLAYGSNLQIVSEVYDGVQAMEELPLVCPDIVFTDIRMATVDGLTLAKQIRENWPHVQVVVVSGYPSFENAREAFKSNVVDFIQKPVHSEIFHELVHKLELRHKHDHGRQWLEHLWSQPSDQDAILATLGELLGPLHYSIFIFRTHLVSGISHERSTSEASLRSIAAELLSMSGSDSHVWLFPLGHLTEMLIVIAAPRLVDSDLQAILTRLRAEFPSFLQVGYRCNLGIDQLKDMKQLHTRFHHCVTLSEPAFVRLPGKSDTGHRGFTRLGSVHDSKIRAILSNRDWNGLERFIGRMLSVWEQEGCSLNALEWNMKKLTGLIAKFAEEATESMVEYEMVAERLVRSSFSYRTLNEKFVSFISREWKPPEIAATREELFAKIRDYLSNHLNEPATLGVLSDLYGVSISYLCSLFKQFTNRTFVEFLTEMRLRKAADLLHTTSLPLKEVAELTGYADQRYFSKVFKAHSGMPPLEFRNRAR